VNAWIFYWNNTKNERENMKKTKTKKMETKSTPFCVGKKYFVRTATMAQLGLLKAVVGDFLVLEKASWIADTGRFHEFLRDGTCSEYEGFPNNCIVPTGSIIDATEWSHDLFSGNK